MLLKGKEVFMNLLFPMQIYDSFIEYTIERNIF